METHHPHHVTHKKKWTEYLLEFFMLFLAVFLGFVAENIRENSVERHREKEYIESEISDLHLDTAHLNTLIRRYAVTVQQYDSLINLLHSEERSTHLNDLYYLGRIISFTPRFNYADRTIQQLKNAGGLRLIKNKKISDSLMVYDGLVNLIKKQDEFIAEAAIEYRNSATGIFDSFTFYEILKGGLGTAVRPVNAPQLLTNDKNKINEIIGKLMYLRSIVVITMDLYKLTGNAAIRLILLLQKEYHLE